MSRGVPGLEVVLWVVRNLKKDPPKVKTLE